MSTPVSSPRRVLTVTTRWGDTVLDRTHHPWPLPARVVLTSGVVARGAGAGAALELAPDVVVARGAWAALDAPDAELVLRVGRLEHTLRVVEPTPTMLPPAARDWSFARTLGVVAALHVCFAALPVRARTPLADGPRPHRGPTELRVPTPPQTKPRTVLEPTARPASSSRGARAAAGGQTHPSARRPTQAAWASREAARRVALGSGLLAYLSSPSAARASVFGGVGVSTGLGAALDAIEAGPSGDAGGALGTRRGPGGGLGGPGGPGGAPLGIGGIGGRRPGAGDGDGGPALRRRAVVRPEPRRAVLVGALSQDEVGRVVRAALPRVRHCYERALGPDPELTGKLAARFTIGGDGRVADADADESSLPEAVDRCVVDVVRTLRFPAPRGGGVVVVRYPFVFATP
jgi:TonB family protein